MRSKNRTARFKNHPFFFLAFVIRGIQSSNLSLDGFGVTAIATWRIAITWPHIYPARDEGHAEIDYRAIRSRLPRYHSEITGTKQLNLSSGSAGIYCTARRVKSSANRRGAAWRGAAIPDHPLANIWGIGGLNAAA